MKKILCFLSHSEKENRSFSVVKFRTPDWTFGVNLKSLSGNILQISASWDKTHRRPSSPLKSTIFYLLSSKLASHWHQDFCLHRQQLKNMAWSCQRKFYNMPHYVVSPNTLYNMPCLCAPIFASEEMFILLFQCHHQHHQLENLSKFSGKTSATVVTS